MNARKNAANTAPEQLPIGEETSFLIEDVQDLMNQNIERYLETTPYRVHVKDYQPEMTEHNGVQRLPYGIKRIEHEILRDYADMSIAEFIGMDIMNDFPLLASDRENPLHITLKWSNNMQVILALVDNLPIVLVETSQGDGTETLFSATLKNRKMQQYLETIGLPESLMGESFEDYLGDIAHASDIRMKRTADHVVDLGTNLTIEHSARLLKDVDDTQGVVQELCVNINHFSEGRMAGLNFPGIAKYRTLLRFARNEKETAWEYRGTYTGKLETGEFIDEQVQADPTLGIPNNKVIDKVLAFLSEER